MGVRVEYRKKGTGGKRENMYIICRKVLGAVHFKGDGKILKNDCRRDFQFLFVDNS